MSMYTVALFLQDFDGEVTDEFLNTIFLEYKYKVSNSEKTIELFDDWFRYPILKLHNQEELVSEADVSTVNWEWTLYISTAEDPHLPIIFKYKNGEMVLSRDRLYLLRNQYEEITGMKEKHQNFFEDCLNYTGQSKILLFKFRLN